MEISSFNEKFGTPTDEQWTKIQEQIKSKDEYNKDDFFVFDSIAVGDRVVPGRYQKIMPSALKVMEQDAKKGVSLMINHNEGNFGIQALPIGRVFDGRIESGKQEGEENTLILSHYILKNDSKIDGYSANDIITLIKAGIIVDTSVAFSIPYETATCSICHNPYFSHKCEHFIGTKYTNEDTGVTRTCILQINAPSESEESHKGNVMLSENSLVYDGAYPNATITQSANGNKLVKMSIDNYKKGSFLSGEKLIGINTTYGFNLYRNMQKGGFDTMDKKEIVMQENENVTQENENIENNVAKDETKDNEILETTQKVEKEEVDNLESEDEEKLSKSDNIDIAFSFKNEELEQFGKSVTKEELLKYAKDGKNYREKVIQDAIKNGVKAMGNDFNVESFKKVFEKMDLEDILNSSETFEKNAKEKYCNSRVSKTVEKVNDTKKSFQNDEIDYSNLKTSIY